MKINIIILILIIILVLYFLYLNTETFKQEESSNSNIEKLPGSYSDITGLYTLDKEKDLEKFIEHETSNPAVNMQPSASTIIPPIETILDRIIKNNSPFALSVTIPTSGIYPTNMENPPEINEKLYLTVAHKSKDYSKCTHLSGMLSLESKLTKGGVFNLSQENRNIPKIKYPYKYLDFYNVTYDTRLKGDYIQSMFYGLQLYNARNYITYCAEGCENNHGFCAQETLFIRHSTEYPGIDVNGQKKKDEYNLKNLLKFVIEGDTATSTTVTPYFVSLDPDERIHYLTNEYNTLYEKNGYKKLVQVPIYDKNERPYYKEPIYVDTHISSAQKKFKKAHKHHTHSPSINNASSLNTPSNTILTHEKIIIKNLDPILTDVDTNAYAKQKVMGVQETQVTKNDAYIHYALTFNIEILTQEQIDALE
jgi:hypothetical protein